jgi:SAM-dependent methyltransferase
MSDVSDMLQVHVSPELLRHAISVAEDLKRSIGLDEPWTSVWSYLSAESRLDMVRRVEVALHADLRGARVLEIGSGMGMFVVVARKLGLDIVGLEPAANSYANLREGIAEMLSCNGLAADCIVAEPGEHLPWPDETFDYVVAFQVLEHVKSPPRTLEEALRVLRPGGRLYMDMPNYHSFIEGHYGLAWWPPLAYSKFASRLYVSAMGRNPAFLKELNFVTSTKLHSWTENLPGVFEIEKDPSEGGVSLSTQGRSVKLHWPGGQAPPTGQRFRGFSAWMKDKVSRPGRARFLLRHNFGAHLVLLGTKSGLIKVARDRQFSNK